MATPQVYQTPRSQTTQAIALFFAGIGCFVLVFLLMGLTALSERKSDAKSDRPPFAPIIMGIFGVGLLGTSFLKVRHSQRIALLRDGLRIDGAFASQFVPWSSLRHTRRAQVQGVMGQSSLDTLELFDTSGTLLTRVGGKIGEFESLRAMLESIVASAHPTPPDAVWVGRAVRQATKRSRIFLYALGIPVGCGFLTGGVWGAYETLKNHRFGTEGVTVQARVEKRFMRSVTPYVEYAFDAPAGVTHRRETMINDGLYQATAGQKTVEVEYLKSDPEWNRLAFGSGESEFGLGMTVMMFGLATFLLGSCVLLAGGWDLNSDAGQMKLTRNGVLVRAWGTAKPKPAGPPVLAIDPSVFPEALDLPYRRPPGLTLLGVALLTLGLAVLLIHVLGIAASAAVASGALGEVPDPATQRELALESFMQGVGVVAGLLGIVGGIGVMRTWTSGWWLGVFASLAMILAAVLRGWIQVDTMIALPDLPGPQGLAVRTGLILGVFLDVILLAAAATLLGVLVSRAVRVNWKQG